MPINASIIQVDIHSIPISSLSNRNKEETHLSPPISIIPMHAILPSPFHHDIQSIQSSSYSVIPKHPSFLPFHHQLSNSNKSSHSNPACLLVGKQVSIRHQT